MLCTEDERGSSDADTSSPALVSVINCDASITREVVLTLARMSQLHVHFALTAALAPVLRRCCPTDDA